MSKERISWYIYDFAKTAFNTSAISVFIGPYFNQIVNNTPDINGNILFFNIINISAGSFYPFIVAISLLLQVLILPICSYIADNTNYSKHILFIATYCGSITTMCFFFINENNYNFTTVDAKGKFGPVKIILMITQRHLLHNTIKLIELHNPASFYSVEDVRYVKGLLPGGDNPVISSIKNPFAKHSINKK
jgi:hypothetical protein